MLKTNRRFQPGLYNKVIFLAYKSRLTQDKSQAQSFIDQARVALTKAAAVDPGPTVGRRAKAALKTLPTHTN